MTRSFSLASLLSLGATLLVVARLDPAHADSSLPPAPLPRLGEWRGQCTDRLEEARRALAHRDPIFAYGFVESVAREVAVPGDPTAQRTLDVVEMSVAVSPALTYFVRVGPREAEPGLKAAARWSEYPSGERHGPALRRYRHGGALVGVVLGQTSDARTLRAFDSAFRKAIDDCLAAAPAAARP